MSDRCENRSLAKFRQKQQIKWQYEVNISLTVIPSIQEIRKLVNWEVKYTSQYYWLRLTQVKYSYKKVMCTQMHYN